MSGPTTRLLGVAVAGWGGALLAWPARATGFGGTVPPPGLVRLLGARCVAQGLVLALKPGRRTLLAAAATDAVHAASMVGLAVADPRYRRPALVSGLVAAATAGIEAYAARR